MTCSYLLKSNCKKYNLYIIPNTFNLFKNSNNSNNYYHSNNYDYPNKYNKIEIFFTYLFISFMLSFISFYSVKYYQLSINNINLCKKNDNYKNTNICIKTEFVQIVLPYFGILCGFIIFSYKTFYYILKFIHLLLF